MRRDPQFASMVRSAAYGTGPVIVRFCCSALLLAIVGGCGRHVQNDSKPEVCADLARELALPSGAPKDQAYCAEELRRLSALARPWGSIQRWRENVYAQGSSIFLELQQRIIETSSGPPFTFQWYPAKTPCGDGLSVTESEWRAGPLGRLGIENPKKLYFSFEVTHNPSKDTSEAMFLSFRIRQDLNCDSVAGTIESEGYAKLGHRLVDSGTWTQTVYGRSPRFISE
jgi:hypothetical protein